MFVDNNAPIHTDTIARRYDVTNVGCQDAELQTHATLPRDTHKQ